MHCPNCARLLAAVSADFVSEKKYYVCLQCSESFHSAQGSKEVRPTPGSNEFKGKNGDGLTVSDFIRSLRVLDARRDEGLAARRLVRKLLLFGIMNRSQGRFHISLAEPLSTVISRIREASGTSECDDMRVLFTGLSLLHLGGALGDRESVANPEAPTEPVEQEMPVNP